MFFTIAGKLLSVLLAAAILLSSFSFRIPVQANDCIPEDPSESVPSESESSEPESSEPEPSDSEPSEPEPSEPEPSEPEPSEPESSEPEPSEPEPSEPEPSEPEPSEPEPSEPEPSEPEPSEPEPSEPVPIQPLLTDVLPEEPVFSGPGLYFGLLHAHSALSEGTVPVEEIFQSAAQTAGLDFFAMTDHSDSFDGHLSAAIGTDGSTVSSDWARGKAAAAAVTGSSFAGIFGYEMSWPVQMKIGHIGTFGTPGFQSWEQSPYCQYDGALEAYYSALSTVSGSVAQFNHPGSQYGTFDNFQYSAQADRCINLIELDFSAEDPCQYYTAALDQGWHLAPTGGRSAATAVHAQSLTETGILDALGSRCAYATEDADLAVSWSLEGIPMGSRTRLRLLGDTMDFDLSLRDPTDASVGLVEMLSNEGTSVAKRTLSTASESVQLSLPSQAGYYFLRITQPDGDRAVTAPIWVGDEEYLGISALTCEPQIPVQDEPLSLTLGLYNRESVPFMVDSLDIFADGIRVFSDDSLSAVSPGSRLNHPITISCDSVGITELTVRLTGTLDGAPRSYEASLTLSFRQSRQVTSILADRGHANTGFDSLGRFKTLAQDHSIRFTSGEVTADTLKDCRFLLVTAPSVPFTDAFLEAAAEFAAYGGSLILCGRADLRDESIHSAAELNRLLTAVGATLRFGDDTVEDPVNHSGNPTVLNSDRFNAESPWCSGISEDQVFRFAEGCSVSPGNGIWLVKGRSTIRCTDGDSDGLGGSAEEAVLMASESLSGGGTVIAAGCLFPDDIGLTVPANLRDPGYANRTITRNLLDIGGEPVALSSIRDARSGKEGELFRIRGYVTAGTSNPYNTFPDTLYLQDDTGGIAVMPFREEGIQIGTALEITGSVQTSGGNRILKPSHWEILKLPMRVTQPKNGNWNSLLDTSENGGTLVEVTGTCAEVYLRENGTLSGCLLKDNSGNTAKIQIDTGIFAGSDGKNELHKTVRKNRVIWAVGLLHINESGETVIRVRNCEEVVWVPPGTYLNPKTGDTLPAAASACAAVSLFVLFLLKKKYVQ